jgi:hypothetical protein
MPTPSLLESPGGTVNGASLNDLFKSLTAGEIRIPSAITLDSRPIVPAPAVVVPAAGLTGNTDGVVRTLFKGIGGARVRNDQTWDEQGNNSAWTIPNLAIDGAVLTLKRKGGDNTAGALCTISKLTGDGILKIDAPTVAVGVVMGQYRLTDTSEFTGDLRFAPGLGNASLDLTATQISPNMLLSLGDGPIINSGGYTLPTCRGVNLLGTPRFDYDFNFGANIVTLAANSTIRVEPGVTVTIGASTTFNRNGKTTSKTRPGTLVFATNNVVAGAGILSITNGTVRITVNPDNLFTSGITVGAGATLDMQASSVSGGYGVRTVTVNGVSAADTSGLYVPAWYNGDIVLSVAPSTIRASNGTSGTIRGFDVNGIFLTVNSAASGSVIDSTVTVLDGGYGYRISVSNGANNATGDLEIKGPIGANAVGGFGLYINGAGHVKFTGSCPAAHANSYWGFGTAFGSFTGKATFAGTFSWASGNSAMPMGFNGTVVWASSVSQTLSGVIGGTGNWTVSGNLTLSGTNTTIGTMTVDSGSTLTIGGAASLTIGATTVNGTLTYTANTTGTRTVTVNAGGVINKGGFAHTGTTFVNNGGTINA